MTFDEFVAEWRRQVREYGSGVPQEAIDMAEQAWDIASATERERCAKIAETAVVVIDGIAAPAGQKWIASLIRGDDNAIAQGREHSERPTGAEG